MITKEQAGSIDLNKSVDEGDYRSVCRLIEYLLKEFKVFNEKNNDQLNKLIDNTSLSSGQMQKVAFIRALLAAPDILLLDEAMANLDEDSKKLFLSIISKQEITVINSTHDPEKYEKIDQTDDVHMADAVGYLIDYLYPVKKETTAKQPLRWGFSGSTR